MKGQNEIPLSDASITAHKVVIGDAKNRLWRFRGEEKQRKK
ncbi:MAG: hypothetical protein N3E39_00065 [Candidatus Methanomethylicia archaeon]|nr:hypothetical protein [Candidatus Methanomethylicia archaeon]